MCIRAKNMQENRTFWDVLMPQHISWFEFIASHQHEGRVGTHLLSRLQPYRPQHQDVCRKAEKVTRSALGKMLSQFPSDTLRVAVQDNTTQTSHGPSCRPINSVKPDRRTARQNAKASHLLQGIKRQQQVTFQPWTIKRGDVEKEGRRRRRRRTALPAAPGEQWSRREVIRDRTSSRCRRVTNTALTRLRTRHSVASCSRQSVLHGKLEGKFGGCKFCRGRKTHLSIHFQHPLLPELEGLKGRGSLLGVCIPAVIVRKQSDTQDKLSVKSN